MRQSQLVRGVLDLAVVGALLQGESHGYEIARRLREAGFPPVADASVYGTLKRLEEWGLLRPRLGRSPDGPQRRTFSVTKEGRSWWIESVREWGQLVDAVGSIVERGGDDERRTRRAVRRSRAT